MQGINALLQWRIVLLLRSNNKDKNLIAEPVNES